MSYTLKFAQQTSWQFARASLWSQRDQMFIDPDAPDDFPRGAQHW